MSDEKENARVVRDIRELDGIKMSDLKTGDVFTNDESMIGIDKAAKERVVDDSYLFQSAADPSKPGYPIVEEDGKLIPLMESFDAQKWAKEFMKTYKLLAEREEEPDEGLMIAWFANAIMSGHDIGRRRFYDRLPDQIKNVVDWEDSLPSSAWPYCSSQGCTNRINKGKSETLCWPHWELETRKKAMEVASGMCGNPVAADGCRNIIALFKDVEKQMEHSHDESAADTN